MIKNTQSNDVERGAFLQIHQVKTQLRMKEWAIFVFPEGKGPLSTGSHVILDNFVWRKSSTVSTDQIMSSCHLSSVLNRTNATVLAEHTETCTSALMTNKTGG